MPRSTGRKQETHNSTRSCTSTSYGVKEGPLEGALNLISLNDPEITLKVPDKGPSFSSLSFDSQLNPKPYALYQKLTLNKAKKAPFELHAIPQHEEQTLGPP